MSIVTLCRGEVFNLQQSLQHLLHLFWRFWDPNANEGNHEASSFHNVGIRVQFQNSTPA